MTHPIQSPPLPQWDFHGECLILSGGARGIGAGLVRHFARYGAHVIFGDTDRVGAEELCAELEAEGTPVYFVEADFTSANAWALLGETAQRLGLAPTLVVANVGIGLNEPLETASLEDFERLFHGNVRSAWLAAREFGPLLRQRPGSSLLLIGSVMARFGTAGHGFYAASKAALSGLLNTLAVEFASSSVRVNMIVPGFILNAPPPLYRDTIPPALWTAFHDRFGPEVVAANPPVQPLAFWGEPEDIAQAASFLHSRAARYITGVELPVDGGLLCQTPIHQPSNALWKWTPEMRVWLEEHGIAPPVSGPE